jgi:hypothetical protein
MGLTGLKLWFGTFAVAFWQLQWRMSSAASRGYLHSLALVTFLHLQSSNIRLSPSQAVISLLLGSSSPFMGPYYIEST